MSRRRRGESNAANIDALLVYANPYYNVRQHHPYGLAVLAEALRQRGLTSEIVFPFLHGRDVAEVVEEWRECYVPTVIGINIRNIDPYVPVDPLGERFGPDVKSRWFLPTVRQLVGRIRKTFHGTPVVLGGTGYSMAPEAISEYLACPAGVAGPGELALHRFVLGAAGGAADPERGFGIRRSEGERDHAPPWVRYANRFSFSLRKTGVPIRTKIGCNRTCSYCTDPLIDGRRVKSTPTNIHQQLAWVIEHLPGTRDVFITDSEFNVPSKTSYDTAEQIALLPFVSEFNFTTQVLPSPFPAELAKVLSEARFRRLLVTVDGFADTVHRRNFKSYRSRDIFRFVELCHEVGIQPVLQNVFGLPGEDLTTLRATLSNLRRLKDEFPETEIEFTLGGRIYPGTRLERMAIQDRDNVYGETSPGHLKPLFYCSPVPPQQLAEIVLQSFGLEEAPDAERAETWSSWLTALAYYADSGDIERTVELLLRADGSAGDVGLEREVGLAIRHVLESRGLDVARRLAANAPAWTSHPFKKLLLGLVELHGQMTPDSS